ncbi:MAG: hypothetical protein IPM06_21505 [Rhizobiales bacterium]|nr:hypothetical protein [Hyphomicrobiales bacterium]
MVDALTPQIETARQALTPQGDTNGLQIEGQAPAQEVTPLTFPTIDYPGTPTPYERTGTVPDLVQPEIAARAAPLGSDTIADPNLPAPAEAEQVDRAVKGVHALFREQRMPLTTTEESLATPPLTRREVALARVEQRAPREAVKNEAAAQMAAVEENAMAVIEPLAATMAATKTKTPKGQAKVAAKFAKAMRGVVQEAAKTGSIEAAQQYVTKNLPTALKGLGVTADAVDMAKAVNAGVGLARTQFSKGATEPQTSPRQSIQERLEAGRARRANDLIADYVASGERGSIYHVRSDGTSTRVTEGGTQFQRYPVRFVTENVANNLLGLRDNFPDSKFTVSFSGTSGTVSQDGVAAFEFQARPKPEIGLHPVEDGGSYGPHVGSKLKSVRREAAANDGTKSGDLKWEAAKFFHANKEYLTADEWKKVQAGMQSESRAALTQDEFEALSPAAKTAALDAYTQAMRAKGTALLARLLGLIGDRPELTVSTFAAAPGGHIGSYTRVGPLKAVISMATNAKEGLSVADHEGYHFAEDWLLTGGEKKVVANALRDGKPLFEQLKQRLQQYDRENGTRLTDEVTGVPAEARAYAFEFWRRGEFQADGALARAWQKIKQFFERVANAVNGLGFQSIEDVFVALASGQMAEREMVAPEGRAAYESRARGNSWYYSALTDAVAAMPTRQASAQGWRDQIKGLVARGAVKQVELDAVGLNEWLDLQAGMPIHESGFAVIEEWRDGSGPWEQVDDLGMYARTRAEAEQTVASLGAARSDSGAQARYSIKALPNIDFGKKGGGKITKDQVMAFLGEHGVQVQEVMLGERSSLRIETDGQGEFNVIDNVTEEILSVGNSYPQAEAYLERHNDKYTADIKFSGYQLPGGTNYRELLLTLPDARLDEYERIMSKRAGGRVLTQDEVDILRNPPDVNNEFRSSHFDQPNILAHVRFNERVDASGRRVLFLEELQSDWAQKGRKEGFKPDTTGWRAEDTGRFSSDGKSYRVYDAKGREIGEPGIGWGARSEEAAIKFAAERQGGPFSAPFVGKTEAWTALVLKRMIRYAAENGFDRVAWTTGEQQAERYDLSKHIDSLHYDPYNKQLSARKGGQQVLKEQGVTPEKIADYVGKDAAQKLLETELNGAGNHELKGVDLKVGGEGMKGYYDKIVPSVANEILRKLGGGKVGSKGVAYAVGTRCSDNRDISGSQAG